MRMNFHAFPSRHRWTGGKSARPTSTGQRASIFAVTLDSFGFDKARRISFRRFDFVGRRGWRVGLPGKARWEEISAFERV